MSDYNNNDMVSCTLRSIYYKHAMSILNVMMIIIYYGEGRLDCKLHFEKFARRSMRGSVVIVIELT